MIRLLEKIRRNPTYAKVLGIMADDARPPEKPTCGT